MRTNLTTDDVKLIVDSIYNGNLAQSIATNGEIPYINENSEIILLKDEFKRPLGEVDLAKYLNIHFYTWKNRLVDKMGGEKEPFDAWVNSLNLSINEAYALVEVLDDKAVASQDIDSATIVGRVTLIIQTNKLANLDYYARKIHNKFLGFPQEIENAYGEKLAAYLNMGIIIYDEEPGTMQLGECSVVSFNFSINYMQEAYNYIDTEISFSFDNETFHKVPITKASLQSIMTYGAVPYYERPANVGVINSLNASTWALTFFDFRNNEFIKEFNKRFFAASAIKIDGRANIVRDINLPVYAKLQIQYDGDELPTTYLYAFVATEMSKTLTNGDFNINSLTLRGSSKQMIIEQGESQNV